MATIETAQTEDKVNWLAEIRGLAIMLLAVLAFHSSGGQAVLHPVDLDDAEPVGG